MRSKSRPWIWRSYSPDVDTWDSQLRTLLGVPQVGEETAGLLCRVLYLPSFHAECCLTMGQSDPARGDRAPLSFTSGGISLWYWRSHELTRAKYQYPPNEPEPQRPLYIKADAGVAPKAVQTFLTSLPPVFPAPDPGCGVMIDGMRIVLEWFDEAGEATVAESNGVDDPATFSVAAALVSLAQSIFQGEKTLAVLQDITLYTDHR